MSHVEHDLASTNKNVRGPKLEIVIKGVSTIAHILVDLNCCSCQSNLNRLKVNSIVIMVFVGLPCRLPFNWREEQVWAVQSVASAQEGWWMHWTQYLWWFIANMQRKGGKQAVLHVTISVFETAWKPRFIGDVVLNLLSQNSCHYCLFWSRLVTLFLHAVQVLEGFLLGNRYDKVVYVGDLHGNLCACTRLGRHDLIFARKGCRGGSMFPWSICFWYSSTL